MVFYVWWPHHVFVFLIIPPFWADIWPKSYSTVCISMTVTQFILTRKYYTVFQSLSWILFFLVLHLLHFIYYYKKFKDMQTEMLYIKKYRSNFANKYITQKIVYI